MKTIVLVGMMGCGKTSTAKVLSSMTGINFIDIDKEIEMVSKLSIPEIFKIHGEKYFRELEKNTIYKNFVTEGLIISLGGGAFENEQTRTFLLENSQVFFLDADSKTLFARVKTDNSRPLLNNDMSVENIDNILNSRIKNYKKAHYIVNTKNKTVAEVAGEILLEVKWKK